MYCWHTLSSVHRVTSLNSFISFDITSITGSGSVDDATLAPPNHKCHMSNVAYIAPSHWESLVHYSVTKIKQKRMSSSYWNYPKITTDHTVNQVGSSRWLGLDQIQRNIYNNTTHMPLTHKDIDLNHNVFNCMFTNSNGIIINTAKVFCRLLEIKHRTLIVTSNWAQSSICAMIFCCQLSQLVSRQFIFHIDLK